jgi:hypothetical protein
LKPFAMDGCARNRAPNSDCETICGGTTFDPASLLRARAAADHLGVREGLAGGDAGGAVSVAGDNDLSAPLDERIVPQLPAGAGVPIIPAGGVIDAIGFVNPSERDVAEYDSMRGVGDLRPGDGSS